jgi:hypothetical protein
MKLTIASGAVALGLLTFAGQASASATLLHSYDFATSVGGNVLDLTGSEDGVLQGDAHVAGGKLVLDGSGDAVQFATQLIPFASDFSVFLRVQIPEPVNGISEIIAQGGSGGPGFYIGNYGAVYRLTDVYYSTSIPFHVDDGFHDLLLTNAASDGFRFSIDGTEVFSAAAAGFGGPCATRLGDQFCAAYGEWFKGEIDTLKIYSGVATYAQATATGGTGAVPEPATWMMMLMGFGGLGALLRRQRRSAAFTAA